MQPIFPPGKSRTYRFILSVLYKTLTRFQQIAFPVLNDLQQSPVPVWQPARRIPKFPYNKKAPAPVQKEIFHRL